MTPAQKKLIDQFILNVREAFKEQGIERVVVTVEAERASVALTHERWPEVHGAEPSPPFPCNA